MTSEIPKGLCQCGCGGTTSIAKKNRYDMGHVKGQPVRFLPNHHNYVDPRYEPDPIKRAERETQYRRGFKARRKARGKAFVREYLLSHPCIDCGEPDPDVLDFDHRDPITKRATISQLIFGQFGISALTAEIAKCDVRCANCHRRKHRQEWKEKSL